MHGYDWLFLLALGCLILASLVALGAWAFDLFRSADDEEQARRAWYQRAIRNEIWRRVYLFDTDPDAEWLLHELLYEYRHGVPAIQGGSLLWEHVDASLYA